MIDRVTVAGIAVSVVPGGHTPWLHPAALLLGLCAVWVGALGLGASSFSAPSRRTAPLGWRALRDVALLNGLTLAVVALDPGLLAPSASALPPTVASSLYACAALGATRGLVRPVAMGFGALYFAIAVAAWALCSRAFGEVVSEFATAEGWICLGSCAGDAWMGPYDTAIEIASLPTAHCAFAASAAIALMPSRGKSARTLRPATWLFPPALALLLLTLGLLPLAALPARSIDSAPISIGGNVLDVSCVVL